MSGKKRKMFILYDLTFILFMLAVLPVYLFKGKFHRGFIRRFGVLPKGIRFDRPIWIHAVSVGEVISVRKLIEGLRKVYPEKNFVISTVTPTGNKIARSIAGDFDFVTYLPFDISFITNYVIKKIKPCIFIIAETEIWPNLISTLHQREVPIAVLNARISDASFKGYSTIRYLIKPILDKINIFCAQSQSDSLKLTALGVNPAKIRVTGNMKFDQDMGSAHDPNIYRKLLGLKKDDILFVAGSTHPKEEGALLKVYRSLLVSFPNLRLLLAPRHPERSEKINSLVKSQSLSPKKVSELEQDKCLKDNAVFILDTIGDLAKFYSAADIVFVGGSLIKKGGHNILEPAFLNKPVIFGPFMFNFRDITQEFLKNKAALQVFNLDGLSSGIKELLYNAPKVNTLIKNAQLVIASNRGATDKNILLIRKIIV